MKKKDFIFLISGSIIVIVLVLAIYFFVGGPMFVNGDSMNPYLEDKDVVMVNRLAYVGRNPERFDLIVFPYKYDKNNKYVKRVIGLPGETIEIINNEIFIEKDGIKNKLIEYYGIYEGISINSRKDFGPVTLGENEYFVLGDNRYHSSDSRQDDVGAVNKTEIIGKVVFRFLPFKNIGSLVD